MEAGSLDGAVSLAVILGRSLRHLPELKARDELVLDVESEKLYQTFCDRILPGNLDCSRAAKHPGRCEAL
jgi:hypothetical protein